MAQRCTVCVYSYDGLVDEENGAGDGVESHEDGDLDGAGRADAAASDREALAHQQQHHHEYQDTHHLEHPACTAQHGKRRQQSSSRAGAALRRVSL